MTIKKEISLYKEKFPVVFLMLSRDCKTAFFALQQLNFAENIFVWYDFVFTKIFNRALDLCIISNVS